MVSCRHRNRNPAMMKKNGKTCFIGFGEIRIDLQRINLGIYKISHKSSSVDCTRCLCSDVFLCFCSLGEDILLSLACFGKLFFKENVWNLYRLRKGDEKSMCKQNGQLHYWAAFNLPTICFLATTGVGLGI